MDIFQQFFTCELSDELLDAMHTRAHQEDCKTQATLEGGIEVLHAYIAVHMAMGLVGFPSLQDYFNTTD